MAYYPYSSTKYIKENMDSETVGVGSTFTKDDLNYTVANNFYVSVSSLNSTTAKDITILSTVEYNGSIYNVTEIGAGAFRDCMLLQNVVLSNELVTIGYQAFQNSSITSVIIPRTITRFGDYAFSNCVSLQTVVLSEGLTTIGESAFRYSGITRVTIPSTITKISSNAFYRCIFLKTVVLNEGLTTIGNNAFTYSGLESVTIPSTITSIVSSPFDNCTQLKSIYFLCKYVDFDPSPSNNFLNNLHIIVDMRQYDSWKNKPRVILKNDNITYYGYPLSFSDLSSVTTSASTINTLTTGANTTFSVGDLTYTVNNELNETDFPYPTRTTNSPTLNNTKYVTVSSINMNTAKDITIPYTFDYNSTTYIVTAIGYCAFAKCKLLKKVKLTEGLAIIGYGAFAYSSVESINIPSTITQFDTYTFYYCKYLKKVELLEGLTIIRNFAFAYSGVESIEIPKSITQLGDFAFAWSGVESIEIPKSITQLGNYAFVYCTSLKKVELSEGLTTIGYGVFAYIGIESINIPSTITQVGDYAFYGCRGLKNVKLPEGLTIIGNSAFAYIGIESITIPSTITTIGTYIFDKCTSLISIAVLCPYVDFNPSSTKLNNLKIIVDIRQYDSWDSYVNKINDYITYHDYPLSFVDLGSFDVSTLTVGALVVTEQSLSGTIFIVGDLEYTVADTKSVYISLLKTRTAKHITISSTVEYNSTIYNVTAIGHSVAGYNSFAYSDIESINIPSSITSIDEWAFYKCSYLKNVQLSEGLTTIGHYAFFNSGIESITIPKSINFNFGQYAFADCKNLKDVVLTEGLTRIGPNAFYNSAIESIYIPSSIINFDYGFIGCKSLQNVVLSDGLEQIGNGAFQDCSITRIIIPPSIKIFGTFAFANCQSLKTIVLSEGLTTINNNAFSYCGIESITIPSTVTFIHSFIFDKCSELESIYCLCPYVDFDPLRQSSTSKTIHIIVDTSQQISWLNGAKVETKNGELIYNYYYPLSFSSIYSTTVNDIPSSSIIVSPSNSTTIEMGSLLYRIDNSLLTATVTGLSDRTLTDIEISNSFKYYGKTYYITAINDNAFFNYKSLKNVKLYDGLKTIGTNAFYNSGIESINIPSTITQFGDNAFFACKSLQNVVLSDGLTTIGANSFIGSGVKSIKIPGSITFLSDSAFRDCAFLQDVQILKGVEIIGSYAFSDCISLTDITLPSGLTTIGSSAFSGSGITSITIPSTVTTIAYNAFTNCKYLTSINFSENFSEGFDQSNLTIQSNAFKNTNITSIEILSATKIGSSAFYNCQDLTEVLLSNKLETIEDYVFTNCTALRNIVLYEGLTTIGLYAFANSGLESITIPSSITQMDSYIFDECNSLTSIYFLCPHVEFIPSNAHLNNLKIIVDKKQQSSWESHVKKSKDEITYNDYPLSFSDLSPRTTSARTTSTPITGAVTTSTPTTGTKTTSAPTTSAPTTSGRTTSVPTTSGKTTSVRTTSVPTTSGKTPSTKTTSGLTTSSPTTSANKKSTSSNLVIITVIASVALVATFFVVRTLLNKSKIKVL